MADPTGFSDDISALWGPAGDSVLAPGPAPAVRAAPTKPEPSPVDAGRLQALEERVADLAASVEANHAVLEGRVDAELVRLHEEAAAATAASLGQIEAQLTARLTELGRQIADIAARPHAAGSAPSPDPDRSAILERQIHEGLAGLGRAIEALEARSAATWEVEALAAQISAIARQGSESTTVGDRIVALEAKVQDDVDRISAAMESQRALFVQRGELKTLWAALKINLAKNLSHVRDDVGARLDSTRTDLERKIHVLRDQVDALPPVAHAAADETKSKERHHLR